MFQDSSFCRAPVERSVENKKLFVKNFQSDLSAAQLGQFFENFGAVAACQIKVDKSGTPVAVVEFAEAQCAVAAMTELDKKNVYGSVWIVRPFKQREQSSGPSSSNVLLVRNLPPNTDKTALKTVFSKFGHVEYVAMSAPNPRTPQWTAYITFADQTGAENALRQMRGFAFADGAPPMLLSFAPPRRPNPNAPPPQSAVSETVRVAEIPAAWPPPDVRRLLELVGPLKAFEMRSDPARNTQTALAAFEAPQHAALAVQSLPLYVEARCGVLLEISMAARGGEAPAAERSRTQCRFHEWGKCLRKEKCMFSHDGAKGGAGEAGGDARMEFFTGKINAFFCERKSLDKHSC